MNSHLAFAATDIASAFATDPDLWHLLTNQMQQLPTVFWGYSLTDAGILQALNPGTVKGRNLKDRWVVLREKDPAAVEYFRALQFNIIIADTQSFLEYLASLPIDTPTVAPSEPTEKLFPEEVIPPLGIGPVRPLLDFYLGDAPTWADVFSGRLYKTKHYSTIENHIHGGRNAIVIGIPACGKTTLLMQCAAGVTFKGHKLVMRPLTIEKATHVVAKLGGSKALLFVDDFAESVDALAYLVQHENITVIAFDREHNYEMVSHKLDKRQFAVLDVTELNAADMQSVFDRIPAEIRHSSFTPIMTQKGVQPSLFELVEANILRPTLKRRFAQVLKELANEPDLLDLLIMVAYVHSCRTPVSFDMAFAFLRDKVASYQEVYALIDKLGQLLSSYSGALLDGDQDHYVSRSIIVSEAIMDQVPGKSFRRVLERFHKEISTLRICRFDIFRRRAFDSEFFVKAFPNWEEGKEFYNEIYLRDPSPYLRQQGALYLAEKKRFHEAFAWIDEALLHSSGRIPSIRHTHAIILFNANIGVAGMGSDSVRSLLDQSMAILTDCYKYDQRKTYHAATFGDQALKYSAVYWDDTAVKYLKQAATWLEEEHKEAPWHRRVKYLLSRVREKLQQTNE